MFVNMDEYMKMLESLSLEQLQALFLHMIINMAITMIVSLIGCFFIARASKLSLWYTFLGLLGMTGLFMMFCRVIAKKNDASPHFIWLGLFGVFGVFIVMGITSYQKVQKMMNSNITYERHQYEQNEQQESQGYNLNGEYHQHDRGSICLNCGAAVAAGEKTCPRCGSRV